MPALVSAFLGTSTVLVTDGQSSVLVDGYFTRPPLLKDGELDFDLAIRPDESLIGSALSRAGALSLDLVVVSHSHLDHALDSPVVAARTGALLGGSASTRMIARGYGFPDERYLLLESGVPVPAGAFTVTPITALHSNGDRIPGEITEPVTLPANALDYKTGGCFDFVIDHPGGTVVVHPTANFLPGALDGVRADVLYLGAGAAGLETTDWRRRYWAETVRATGARTVRLVHWEMFWEPIDAPMRPLPPPIDDLDETLADFTSWAHEDGVDLQLAALWTREPVRN